MHKKLCGKVRPCETIKIIKTKLDKIRIENTIPPIDKNSMRGIPSGTIAPGKPRFMWRDIIREDTKNLYRQQSGKYGR